MEQPQAIYDSLRQAGHRLTEARKALVDFFCTHKRPVSAETVSKKIAKQKETRAHMVTIYRELEFLEKQGVITCVYFDDRKARYELASRPHHHHLVCKKCHSVQDIRMNDDLRTVERRIAKQKDFIVSYHSLEFFGLCKSCK